MSRRLAVCQQERDMEGFHIPLLPTLQVDSKEVQQIKSMIRSSEARSAARTCGCDVDNLHFLDMPFYETGKLGSPARHCRYPPVSRKVGRAGTGHSITAKGQVH